MRSSDRDRRNVGLVAHIDAGKTTLTEQLLYLMGVIRRPGAVDDASTVGDWMRQEQERGITIGSAAVTCHWRDTEMTLVDTPGHVDFTVEVERSLTVLDGAVVVLSGPEGVQAQTQTVWHQAARRRLPVIGFVNKLDRWGFDDAGLQAEVRDRLGIEPVPLQLPLTWGGDRIALIDVLGGERLVWDGGQRRAPARAPRREPLGSEEEELERAIALERLGEAIADHDDELAELLIADGEPEAWLWRRALRRAVRARACLPLIYGAAHSGVGPSALLDAVRELHPPPEEAIAPAIWDARTGESTGRWGEAGRRDATTTAFVFKTESRRRGRRFAWVRVFSGSLASGERVYELPEGTSRHVGGLARFVGGEEEPVERLDAGAIGGIPAEPDEELPASGRTLAERPTGATFESIRAPRPVIAMAVEAPDLDADARMRRALERIVADDPSLALLHDEDGRTLLAGMGELHLELALERLRADHGVEEVRAGSARPRRRRVLREAATGRARSRRQGTPHGEAEVRLRLRPRPGGEEEPVRWAVDPPAGPEWRHALEAGILSVLRDEADVTDAEVAVEALERHGAGLTPHRTWEAAREATQRAIRRAGTHEAEPWMALSIAIPDEHVGAVTADLARRRGAVLGSTTRGALQVLSAEAPLAELIRYATELRSLTGGRGTFTMEPLGYRPADDPEEPRHDAPD